MKIQELELQLKEIDPAFEIRVNTNVPAGEQPEIAGVYWDGHCAYIGMPAQEIFETRNPNFLDSYGNVHRGADEVIGMAKAFLKRMNEEPEYRDLITATDEQERTG